MTGTGARYSRELALRAHVPDKPCFTDAYKQKWPVFISGSYTREVRHGQFYGLLLIQGTG